MPQPPLVIDPLGPPPLPPGLFSVAVGPRDLPDHAGTAGMIWTPDTLRGSEVYATPCQAPPYPTFTPDNLEGLAQAWPFIAYSRITVGAAGWTEQEIQRRAEQRLMDTEQWIAERALMGVQTMDTFLNVPIYAGSVPPAAPASGVHGGILQQVAAGGSAAGFTDLGTAGTVTEGVSLLEQLAADTYYGQATIHARPRIAAYAGQAGQYRVIGLPKESNTDNQYTQNWNAWAFGNGYAGTGPTNQAADATSEYMWITGRVIVWRGPVFFRPPAQVFDRLANQRQAFAWRWMAIGVEGFAGCVKVTRAIDPAPATT